MSDLDKAYIYEQCKELMNDIKRSKNWPLGKKIDFYKKKYDHLYDNYIQIFVAIVKEDIKQDSLPMLLFMIEMASTVKHDESDMEIHEKMKLMLYNKYKKDGKK